MKRTIVLALAAILCFAGFLSACSNTATPSSAPQASSTISSSEAPSQTGGALPPSSAQSTADDETLLEHAAILTDHLVTSTFTDQALGGNSLNDDEIKNFVVALCGYMDEPNHPYFSIIHPGEETSDVYAYYLDSDVQAMVAELFGVEAWQYPDLLETDAQNQPAYCIPYGIGLPHSPYSYSNSTVQHNDDGTISVSFDLADTLLYGEEAQSYGRHQILFRVLEGQGREYLRFEGFYAL